MFYSNIKETSVKVSKVVLYYHYFVISQLNNDAKSALKEAVELIKDEYNL